MTYGKKKPKIPTMEKVQSKACEKKELMEEHIS